jgi:hypothetical protein
MSEQTQEVLFLFWPLFEKRCDDGKCLGAYIGDGVPCEFLFKQEVSGKKNACEKGGDGYLQNCEHAKEPFFEPILEPPNEEMLVLDIWMGQRLLTKVSVMS